MGIDDSSLTIGPGYPTAVPTGDARIAPGSAPLALVLLDDAPVTVAISEDGAIYTAPLLIRGDSVDRSVYARCWCVDAASHSSYLV